MQFLARGAFALISTLSVFTLLASTADARIFRMTGNWHQQRGEIAEIPIFGGIPHRPAARVSATGSAPATLTVPPGAFTGSNMLLFPLPQTTLVQLSTNFTFQGPGSAGVISSGPKGTRPANFSFCPGAAANPACTSTGTLNPTQGTRHGRVIYSAGPNQFGGTMQMLIGGGGSVTAVVQVAPTQLQVNAFGGGTMMGPQLVGGAYANAATDFLPPGPITSGAVCASGPCAANGGLVVTLGVPAGTGTASTNFNTGFPWTTGMVSAIVLTKLPTTNSTLTGTGSDTRTALGLGNITLVAGGMSGRKPSNTSFGSIDTITMNIAPRDNLPSMTPMGLATLATAIVLGAGYASRKRRSRKH